MDCFARLRDALRAGNGRYYTRSNDEYSSMIRLRWRLWKTKEHHLYWNWHCHHGVKNYETRAEEDDTPDLLELFVGVVEGGSCSLAAVAKEFRRRCSLTWFNSSLIRYLKGAVSRVGTKRSISGSNNHID